MTEECRIYSLGRHSNFPQCCVLFFISLWRNMVHINYVRDQVLGIGTLFGYVPCPECLVRGAKAEVHICAGLPCDSFYRWERP